MHYSYKFMKSKSLEEERGECYVDSNVAAKLVKSGFNMQEKMDTVKSNKSIVFTILFDIILFGGIYFIQTFVDIPKIDNLYLNIGVLIAFIVGVLTYLFSNVYVGKFLNQKTSNKSILKTIIVMLVIVSLFFIFPLIENFTAVSWQVFIARIGIIAIFVLICMFIFKKIDKC